MGVMTDPDVTTVERKLDETLAQLKATRDPERKRILLKQMRTQMMELDRLVFDHTRLPKPPPGLNNTKAITKAGFPAIFD